MNSTNIVIGLVVVAVIGVGAWFALGGQMPSDDAMMHDDNMTEEGDAMMHDDATTNQEGDAMMHDDAMSTSSDAMHDDGAMMEGEVNAGAQVQ